RAAAAERAQTSLGGQPPGEIARKPSAGLYVGRSGKRDARGIENRRRADAAQAKGSVRRPQTAKRVVNRQTGRIAGARKTAGYRSRIIDAVAKPETLGGVQLNPPGEGGGLTPALGEPCWDLHGRGAVRIYGQEGALSLARIRRRRTKVGPARHQYSRRVQNPSRQRVRSEGRLVVERSARQKSPNRADGRGAAYPDGYNAPRERRRVMIAVRIR